MSVVNALLGNILVNKFPGRQIFGKQSVARLRNNRGSCVFRVSGGVTTVDTDHVICVPFLGYISKAVTSYCAGKSQQHIQKTDPSSRQRGRPTRNKTVTVKK
jgi:hypothetical protein